MVIVTHGEEIMIVMFVLKLQLFLISTSEILLASFKEASVGLGMFIVLPF